MNRKQTPAELLRQLPAKWAVAVVVSLILYALVQPIANKRLGLQLPSLLGTDSSETMIPSGPDTSTGTSDKATSNHGESDEQQSEQTENQPQEELRYGLLRDLGNEEFMSPGGLRYTRGSAEGHRLKHLERHLKDQPDRPGKHGVFYGDMPQVIRWLDDVYERGKSSARGTRQRVEDDRTVYEAPFDKPVGFVGGRDGARDNNPDALKIRLVVQGNQVITAFPF